MEKESKTRQENIYSHSTELQTLRKAFASKVSEWRKNQEIANDAEKLNSFIHPKNENDTFDKNELVELASRLPSLYEIVPKSNDCGVVGIPGELLNFLRTIITTDEDDTDSKETIFNKKRSTRQQKLSSDAAINYQQVYIKCIEKLFQLDIQIQKVCFLPENYFNQTCSSLLISGPCIKFTCKKNQYTFDVDFKDDCDCEPGILRLQNLVNTETQEKLDNANCDLFCRNTSAMHTSCFLELLECKSIREFIEKKYGIYFQLNDLLNNLGFPCELIANYDQHILVNENTKLEFYLRVRIEDFDILLIPLGFRDDSFYKLCVAPAFCKKGHYLYGDGNDSTDLVDKNFPIKDLITLSHYRDYGKFVIHYTGPEDLQTLVKFMYARKNFELETFGFYENSKFYSYKDINDAFNKEYSDHDRVCFINNEDLVNGKMIDTILKLKVGYWWDALMQDVAENINLPCPIETWTFHFTYNLGEQECNLKIDGKYFYANDIGKTFWLEKEKFGEIKRKEILHPICPTTEYKGSFTHVLKIAQEFIEKLER